MASMTCCEKFVSAVSIEVIKIACFQTFIRKDLADLNRGTPPYKITQNTEQTSFSYEVF